MLAELIGIIVVGIWMRTRRRFPESSETEDAIVVVGLKVGLDSLLDVYDAADRIGGEECWRRIFTVWIWPSGLYQQRSWRKYSFSSLR